MIRRPDWSASDSTTAVSPAGTRTVPLTTISSPILPNPRNCTPRRARFSGPPTASVCARDLRHRPPPVEDATGEPDPLGVLLVDVDRVEVARRARVANRHV